MNLSLNVGDDPRNVHSNRELFFGTLGIRAEELAIPGQVHSDTVRRVDVPGVYPETDALVTDVRRLFLCVTVADCVPILLFDPVRRVVAAIHAGWRGTAGTIAARAVRLMMDDFGVDPANLLGFIGPSADTCCYEVGPDVASRFPERFVSDREGSLRVDLKSANLSQLIDLGVPPENIETSSLCTISEETLLHSYRRDGVASGRMMAVIGLAAD
jgi:hypothetical protein